MQTREKAQQCRTTKYQASKIKYEFIKENKEWGSEKRHYFNQKDCISDIFLGNCTFGPRP